MLEGCVFKIVIPTQVRIQKPCLSILNWIPVFTGMTVRLNQKVMQVEEEIKALGYRVVYVPEEVVGHHLACYNVEYEGKVIRPRVARRLKIPLNEIWISETLKNQAERVL